MCLRRGKIIGVTNIITIIRGFSEYKEGEEEEENNEEVKE
jgi:hypothetical protein